MPEREFRGFGMVEQWDAENFDMGKDGTFQRPATRLKCWFHLGRLPTANHLASTQMLQESEVDQLTVDAYRALKGLPIREELYGDDLSEDKTLPYLSRENSYNVRTLQPCNVQRQGVYRVIPREHLMSHTERSSDPRLLHEINLQVDDYGRVTKSVSITYEKTVSTLECANDRAKQEETVVLYTEIDYTNPIDSANDFRLPLPCETRKYRVSAASQQGLFDYSTLVANDFAFFRCASEVALEDADLSEDGEKALVARDRVLYRSSNLSTCLQCGRIETYSVIDQTFQLAITPGNLSGPLSRVLPPAGTTDLKEILETEGGYRDLDGDNHWWIPSEQSRYSATTNDMVCKTHTPNQELRC
jgi:Insecticide toxin TcdB middle/C-terminal region